MKNSKYSIDHFSITVSSLEQSIDFYRKNFGFREVKRADKTDLKIKLAMLQLGDSYLELIEPYNQEPKLIITDSEKKSLSEILEESKSHLAISADKIHLAYLQLKENNVETITLINDKFFFCRDPFFFCRDPFFFCRDPDGYLIEVRQR